jgi:hypothetical protein
MRRLRVASSSMLPPPGDHNGYVVSSELTASPIPAMARRVAAAAVALAALAPVTSPIFFGVLDRNISIENGPVLYKFQGWYGRGARRRTIETGTW